MKIVRISGGLGNQLFQLAFYEKLSRDFPDEEIKIDLSFYKDQNCLSYWLYRKLRKIPYRKFMFNEQLNNEKLDSIDLLSKLYKRELKVRLVVVLNYLIPLRSIFKLTNINLINENNFDNYEISEADVIYDGYWQNIRYVRNGKFFIVGILKDRFFKEFVQNRTSNIVLHIRRGDQATVLSSNIYSILNIDYYERAINYIKLQGECFNEITICSDDIQWCKENVQKLTGVEKINYSNSSSMIQDFLLMFNAKYLISSNSTFSWWAGYVGNSVEFLIPKRWYTSSPSEFINESNRIIEI